MTMDENNQRDLLLRQLREIDGSGRRGPATEPLPAGSAVIFRATIRKWLDWAVMPAPTLRQIVAEPSAPAVKAQVEPTHFWGIPIVFDRQERADKAYVVIRPEGGIERIVVGGQFNDPLLTAPLPEIVPLQSSPNELPGFHFRPLHSEPNPFEIVPCCERGRAAYASRYGGAVSIIESDDGPGVNDVVFCPWCGKRFEVRRKDG